MFLALALASMVMPVQPFVQPTYISASSSVPSVPFYSQFKDISSPSWQKVGCGITSLAMIIDYYQDAASPSVNQLLKEGIAAGAYLQNAGWTYKGLIGVSKKYGFKGSSYDLGKQERSAAFAQFKKQLQEGPVIASVHYKFDPKSTIPHLVVITAIDGDTVYYNDPAAKVGEQKISVEKFLKAWKKRFIVVRPEKTSPPVALSGATHALSFTVL